jgi:hypothetical protein
MTKEIPGHVIAESYLYAGTAYDIAAGLNRYYVPLGCRRISGRDLIERWAAEVETNTPLRQLGPRPERGFEQDEKINLVKKLVTA